MLMQKPACILADNQVDYYFVPGDVFIEEEFYKTKYQKGFSVNGNVFEVLLVPYPEAVAKGLAEAQAAGCKVIFLDALPESTCQGSKIPHGLTRVVQLEKLKTEILKLIARPAEISPANNRIRILHYLGEKEVYMVNNEGTETYRGKLILPEGISVYEYDAWEDQSYTADIRHGEIPLCEGVWKMRRKLNGDEERIVIDQPALLRVKLNLYN